MATETDIGVGTTETLVPEHLHGIAVTTVASLAGVFAALVAGVVVGTTPEAATDSRLPVVLVAFLLLQAPVLEVMGISLKELGAKGVLYQLFMTFAMWFVTLTILLSSPVAL